MQNGKGDKNNRVKNWQKYRNNYDSINWSEKPETTIIVKDDLGGTVIGYFVKNKEKK